MKNLFVFGIAIIIMAVLCRIIIKHSKSKRLKNKRFKAVIVGVFAVLSMTPIVRDFLLEDYSYAYYEKELFSTQIIDFDNATNVGQLIDGRIIEQTFYCDIAAISSVDLYTQTYDRINNGTLTVQLIDMDNENIINTWNVDLREIPNNDYLHLSIDNPFSYEVNGRECELKIYSEGATTDDCVTLISVPNQYLGGEILADGETSNSDLVCSISGFGDVSNMENVRIWICLLLLIAVESILCCKVEKED